MSAPGSGQDASTLERVLILVKGPRDAELTRSLLANDGLYPVVCRNSQEFCELLEHGGAAALLADWLVSSSPWWT